MISNNPTPVNEFPESLLNDITETLARVTSEHVGRKIAAFDADGTLWDTDAGEAFFDFQIKHCNLKGLPPDPWKYYLDGKATDPAKAYMWLAQISAGHSLKQVRDWASECVSKTNPYPVLKSQHEVIKVLRKLGFEIFVVTASVKWAVEPAARLVGVDQDHVLGITTEVVDGIVTNKPVYPVTWRKGKAEAILNATGGVRPIFCSGNTDGDLALLEIATHLPLAVSTQNAPSKLNDSEARLREEAIKRGWRTHAFRPATD